MLTKWWKLEHWLPILVAMHKLLPNLVLFQTDKTRLIKNSPIKFWWLWYNPELMLINMFITCDSKVIIFSPCVFVCVCVCVCLSVYVCHDVCPDDLTMKDWCLTNNIQQVHCWGIPSCASYVSPAHDGIDDVTRSQSKLNFEMDISPSIFELERRSKAQNVGNVHGYLSDIFNFRYNVP